MEQNHGGPFLSKLSLTAILERIPIGIGLMDREGRWILTNSAMRQFVSATIPSRDPNRIQRWRAFAVNGQALQPDQWPGARALRGETVNPSVECSYTDSEGRELSARVAATPIPDSNGNIIGAVATVEDTTAFKQAEDRFHLATEAAPSGMILSDDEGRIILINAQGEKLLGYGRDELIGQKIEMLLPDRFRRYHPILRGNFSDQPTARPMGVGRDLYALRKDGTEVPVEIGLSPITTNQGPMVLSALVDVTERKRAEERQRLLLAELNHRVKNILAQVAVVATSTRQGSRSIDEFLAAFDSRIRSMASAHALLSESGWQSARLEDLVLSQLAPYATDTNVTISGTNVVLNSAETQAVARTLHELATNAAKYGALSTAGGQVSVNWDLRPDGPVTNLTLVWREFGGPPAVSEHPSGYGTNLIRDLIPHELGGTIDLVFAKEGANCRIEIPIRES